MTREEIIAALEDYYQSRALLAELAEAAALLAEMARGVAVLAQHVETVSVIGLVDEVHLGDGRRLRRGECASVAIPLAEALEAKGQAARQH